MLQRLLKVVGINLLCVVVIVFAAELTFGGWVSSDLLDTLDIQRNANVIVDASSLYPGGKAFTYRRNKWGFRGPDIDPATIDILTVGGSTTNQLYLSEDETWQAVMARRLGDLGRTAVVANAGLDGQSTVGLLANLDAWFPHVPGLKPKIILAYIGLNDVVIGGSSIDRLAFSSFHKWFRTQSALFRLGRVIEGAVLARMARLTHTPIDFASAAWTDRGNYPDVASALPQADPGSYGARLNEIARKIRALGATPVFVTQPRGDSRFVRGKLVGLSAASGLNGIDEARLLARFNDVTRTVCRTENVRCVDVAAGISFGDGDFYDRVHNTPQGAAEIGRFIAENLGLND